MLVCLAGVHLSVVGGLGCVTGLGLGIFPRDVLALQQAIGIRGSSKHHNAGPVIHIKEVREDSNRKREGFDVRQHNELLHKQ